MPRRGSTLSTSTDSRGDAIRRVRWSRLRPDFLEHWPQGEHVAIIGPTGVGKSTLALDLLEARAAERDAHVVVLATKRRDPTLAKLGWPTIGRWPPDYEHRVGKKVILWPPYGKASTARANRAVYEEALDEILEEGGWTVYLDEAIYFTETLGLRHMLDEYWNTARSSRVTVVASSQGTTWIPRAMITQQSWVFVFRPRNEEVMRDAATVAGGRDRFLPAIDALRAHEFVLAQTVSGEAYVSRVGT
jgi:energy-coupling factor transporter ATP-binding protein EcfA2